MRYGWSGAMPSSSIGTSTRPAWVGRGIQVGGHEDHVVALGRHLAVPEDVRIVAAVEAQVPVELQRAMLAADAVDPRDEADRGCRARSSRVTFSSYFSEFRYSSEPGANGAFSHSS